MHEAFLNAVQNYGKSLKEEFLWFFSHPQKLYSHMFCVNGSFDGTTGKFVKLFSGGIWECLSGLTAPFLLSQKIQKNSLA